MNTYNIQQIQKLNNIRNELGDNVIEKIEKLLALGERNPNPNESKSALNKVGELCSKYNVDLSDVRKLIKFKNAKIDISKLASKMARESQSKEASETKTEQEQSNQQYQSKQQYEQTQAYYEDLLKKYQEEILKSKQRSQEYHNRRNSQKNYYNKKNKLRLIGKKIVGFFNSLFCRLMSLVLGIISYIVLLFACIFSLGLPYGVYCVYKIFEQMSNEIPLENIKHTSYIIPCFVVPIVLFVVLYLLRAAKDYFWLKY